MSDNEAPKRSWYDSVLVENNYHNYRLELKGMDTDTLIKKLVSKVKANARYKEIIRSYRSLVEGQGVDKALTHSFENAHNELLIRVAECGQVKLKQQVVDLTEEVDRLKKALEGERVSLNKLTSEKSKWLRKIKRLGG